MSHQRSSSSPHTPSTFTHIYTPTLSPPPNISTPPRQRSFSLATTPRSILNPSTSPSFSSALAPTSPSASSLIFPFAPTETSILPEQGTALHGIQRRFSNSFPHMNNPISNPPTRDRGRKLDPLPSIPSASSLTLPTKSSVKDTHTPSPGLLPKAPTSRGTTLGHLGHLNVIEKLKPSRDPLSRSNSPMRSMILNGQMLD